MRRCRRSLSSALLSASMLLRPAHASLDGDQYIGVIQLVCLAQEADRYRGFYRDPAQLAQALAALAPVSDCLKRERPATQALCDASFLPSTRADHSVRADLFDRHYQDLRKMMAYRGCGLEPVARPDELD